MKKIGISNTYSYLFRVFGGVFLGYITYSLPSSWFDANISSKAFEKLSFHSFYEMIINSIQSSIILSVQIIVLITTLIFIMDFIKTREVVKNSKKNVSKGFSIVTGVILGITYGAGILIEEAKSGNISKEDLFYIGTFLMICHAIIEDTLLFVIFGADFTMVVLIRTVGAIIISWIALEIFKEIQSYKNKKKRES